MAKKINIDIDYGKIFKYQDIPDRSPSSRQASELKLAIVQLGIGQALTMKTDSIKILRSRVSGMISRLKKQNGSEYVYRTNGDNITVYRTS